MTKMRRVHGWMDDKLMNNMRLRRVQQRANGDSVNREGGLHSALRKLTQSKDWSDSPREEDRRKDIKRMMVHQTESLLTTTCQSWRCQLRRNFDWDWTLRKLTQSRRAAFCIFFATQIRNAIRSRSSLSACLMITPAETVPFMFPFSSFCFPLSKLREFGNWLWKNDVDKISLFWVSHEGVLFPWLLDFPAHSKQFVPQHPEALTLIDSPPPFDKGRSWWL